MTQPSKPNHLHVVPTDDAAATSDPAAVEQPEGQLPEGATVRVVSMAETEPQSAEQWAVRRANAETEMYLLIAKYKEHNVDLDVNQVNGDSWRILLDAWIQEGKISGWDEVQARLTEYQLLYMRATWNDAVVHSDERRLITPDKPQLHVPSKKPIKLARSSK